MATAPSSLCSSQACSGLQINILGFLVALSICIHQVFWSSGSYFHNVPRGRKKKCRSCLWEKHPSLGNVLFEIPVIRFSCVLCILCIWSMCPIHFSSQDETAVSFLEDCSSIAWLLPSTASELGPGHCQCSGRCRGRKQDLPALEHCAHEQDKLRQQG